MPLCCLSRLVARPHNQSFVHVLWRATSHVGLGAARWPIPRVRDVQLPPMFYDPFAGGEYRLKRRGALAGVGVLF
jgi:hypothetical protein